MGIVKVEILFSHLRKLGIDFFTGVPDSQLKSFCSYLLSEFGISEKHIVAANEGNAAALAAGYYLATGKIPCIYLQNSGLGNIVNPFVSLLSNRVYSIPSVFIIGWRGEPGVKDEPQHVFQGEITLSLLNTLSIEYSILDKETTAEELEEIINHFRNILKEGKSVALVVKKGALQSEGNVSLANKYVLNREQVIESIVSYSDEDIIVSTTGKTSRELFEIRERNTQSHKYDFLTVGSMGHSSSIALGIALKTKKNVWCLDGDGAFLMHMGSVAIIGSMAPRNFIHVVLNNVSHESVGGIPTVMDHVDIPSIALACGYNDAISVHGLEDLEQVLQRLPVVKKPYLIEVKISKGSRENLGRPTTTPCQNKESLMKYIKEKSRLK